MKDRSVACKSVGADPDGRTIGLCRADGKDLGRAMVRDGMAWAYSQYGRAYNEDEAIARAANLGVHGHECEPPWEWRTNNLPQRFWQLDPVEAAGESQDSHK
jgi:endonuclease YncB( thermonuclease family)